MESVGQCIALFQQAIDLENIGAVDKAIELYETGVTRLSSLLGDVKDQAMLSQCIDALKMYKDRVVFLKNEQQKKLQTTPQVQSQVQFPELQAQDFVQVKPSHGDNNNTFSQQNSYSQTFQPQANTYQIPQTYQVSDKKDFNGQVDDVLSQVYSDIAHEQNAQVPLQNTYQTDFSKPQNTPFTQTRVPPPVPLKRSVIDQDIAMMDDYISSTSKSSDENLTQEDRDRIYATALQKGEQSLWTSKDERNMQNAIRDGQRAQSQIQREEAKFNKLCSQSKKVDKALGLK
ncbi:hypothetical protein EIN_047170 [Entamoeba invadens IP1]|uniref:MIT domain-containing protein n=1 Tax=Entamoeba invadens IP1 TaxID=370355 RepID=A0A0A1UDB2_ENTIV|nr:hypothetical protein EIN_047170 [Entamoeba invadens IP1]ELP94434.1 hypothetical protein EIN_047170 [Entamoeba invadens IP1]|eukprot:XP_004261205.1 hypothetical protein EIN_047170 [Entamoeba invadens IP1]